MPSAGLEPATPSLGRRRSGPLSYEGLRPAGRIGEVIIDIRRSGRSSARLECTVRDREVGGSNPLAPTLHPHPESSRFSMRFRVLPSRSKRHDRQNPDRHADVRRHRRGRDVVLCPACTHNLPADAPLITRSSAARCRQGWRPHPSSGARRRGAPSTARYPRP